MKCLYCNSDRFQIVFTSSDLILLQCKNCNWVVQKDFGLSNGVDYAEQSHCITTRDDLRSRSDIIATIIKNFPNGTIVDVGCGYGGFMKALLSCDNQLTVIGIEPSKQQANYCVAEGLACKNDFLHNDLFDFDIDVITFLQVLEHFSNPIEALTSAYSLLRPGGWVIIEVPNYNNPKTLLYKVIHDKRLIKRDFIKSHVSYFTPVTLSNIVSHTGFEITNMQTGRYAIRYDANNIVKSLLSIFDLIANRIEIGGILMYAQKPIRD